MKDKVAVIVDRDRDGCAELKRRRPDLKYLDVSDPTINRLADQLKFKYVPAVVVVQKNKVCLLDDA